MADRQANFANNWSTVLDAEMGPTALTAVVASTTGAPSSPCYLLLDHDDNNNREYIYFDGTFTATDFVTLGLGNRYLAGSAAGSGITHAVGATVRAVTAAQALEDLHDRIDADRSDFDGHDHDADYAAAAHSHTTGSGAVLQFDDHELTAATALSTTLAVVLDDQLECTFTAPSSGNVLVDVSVFVRCDAGARAILAVSLDGSTEAQDSEAVVLLNGTSANVETFAVYRKKLTGLSGSQTVNLMGREYNGNATISGGTSPDGPSWATMTVVELP